MSTQGAGAPPLRTLRAGEIDRHQEGLGWLVESLWPHSAVGIVGGQPKSWKSWLALDLAVSVASATPCLSRYRILNPGTTLVYLAEDALPDVRARIECLCTSRALAMQSLDLNVIAEPVLRLDQETDRLRLREAVVRLAPRLLVLDPLVRLHRLDENSSTEISGLLGYLRELQRAHDVSVALVHHTSKRAQARAGQSLRGSSDLHAWTDVGLYLTWHGERLRLTPELRTAKAQEPVELRLVADDPAATHLVVHGTAAGGGEDASPAPALAQRALRLIEREAPASMRRSALRDELRVNNAKLGEALGEIERQGFVVRGDDGWRLVRRATP
jgi:hypothetical protein